MFQDSENKPAYRQLGSEWLEKDFQIPSWFDSLVYSYKLILNVSETLEFVLFILEEFKLPALKKRWSIERLEFS